MDELREITEEKIEIYKSLLNLANVLGQKDSIKYYTDCIDAMTFSVIKRKIMNSKKELILKYKRQIQQMEKAIDLHEEGHAQRLYAKVSILKMVIIDLQE